MKPQGSLLRRRQQREAQERADMAREQHTAFRLAEQMQRQQRRQRMTLGRRVDVALAQARKLSDVSGVGMEQHVSTGKAESSPPPGVNGLLYGQAEGSVFDHFARRLRLMVQALEREIDGGSTAPIDVQHELPEEKDARLIKDFEGVPSWEVPILDPSYKSKAAVERARIRMERDPRLGRGGEERHNG